MLHRLTYPALMGISYLGTRFLGLEKTILGFRKVGETARRLGVVGDKAPSDIRDDLDESYHVLPISVRCLDQAVVTWSLLNLHGHKAEMKIGVNLAPFMSHAWVEMGRERFVDFVYIDDMQVVAQYGPWP